MDHDIRRLRIDVDNLESNYNSMNYESYYLLTDNNIDVPSKDDSGWSTTLPPDIKDKYLWIMNVIDTGVAKLKTEPFCTNNGGGENILDMDIEFIQTKSRTTPPLQSDEGWSTDAPTHLIGRYIWSRTKITSNHGVKYSEPVCITGDSGVETSQGLLCGTKDGLPLYMHIRYCTLNNPLDISQTSLQPQKYIGYYVDGNVVDSTDISKYSWKIKPVDGLSYTLNDVMYYMHIKYAYDDIGTGLNEESGSFIGYYYDNNLLDSTDVNKYFYFKVESKGILNIYEEYTISNEYVNSPTDGWSTVKPSTTDEKPYLWSRNLIKYTDNSTQAVNILCLSALDGDDVHYIFCRTNSNSQPETPPKTIIVRSDDSDDDADDDGQWFENPQGVRNNFGYEWVCKQLKINGVWSNYSAPALWASLPQAPNDGYVHFAYANDDKGETDFSTENSTNRKYMGTYYDYVQETSQDPSRYTWSLIKGEDGKTPSTEEIVESVNESGVDAKTLDGKSPINFLSSVIPTTYIYRDESDKTQNYIVIYELGNIVIVQFYKFSGNSSDYGNDGEYYFRLFPNDGKHEIPERLRPPVPIYTNDLNLGDGTSNGRLKITPAGVIGKGNNTSGPYSNTFGTFIYTINPRTLTVLSDAISTTVEVGDYLSVTLKDSSNNLLGGRSVAFTVNGKNYYKTTDNSGIAKIPLRLNQGEYNILGVFNGDITYAPCEKSYTVNVVKTIGNIQFSGGAYQNTGYVLQGDILTVTALNNHGEILPNFELLINNTTYKTDENGEVKLTVKENGTFICKFAESTNEFISNRATYSNTVKITGKTAPITTHTRVPLSLSAAGTNNKIKRYNSDSLNVARVQKRENNSSASTAITCTHNSSVSAYLRTTPAQIYFNVFKFPRPNKACTVTATVFCGEFGGITGGNMYFPKLQLKDVINNIVYDEKTTQGNFGVENKNTYLPFTITHPFTAEQASAIESDNLALLIIPQESHLKSTASYNVSEFRIDYVEMKIQY